MSGAVQPLLGYGAAAPIGPLNLTISQDYIQTNPSDFAGLLLSQLMNPTQQAQYQAGSITTVNISGTGSPSRGYWVVSGFADTPVTAGSTFLGTPGFSIDLDSPSNVTMNIDSSILRIYGAGGGGGNCLSPFISPGADGGDAIQMFGGSANLDLNITNQVGSNIGKIIAGGGGGNGGSADLGAHIVGGGGGAAGWNPGIGGPASGTTPAYAGANGGIYDAHNGGADNPAVAGGLGGSGMGVVTPPGAGNGGGLATAGNSTATLPGTPGQPGLAVNREGQPGTTTIVSGGGVTNIIGTVQ